LKLTSVLRKTVTVDFFGAGFVKPHTERKKYFMTFMQYCPFLIDNYFSAHDVEFQFSTLLLLDIARQKVLSKSRRELKLKFYC